MLKIIAITLEYRAGQILQPSKIIIQMRSTTEDIHSDFLKTDFDPKILVEEFTVNGKKQTPITYFTFLEYRYCNIHWHQTAIEYSNIGLFIEKGILPPKKSLIESFKQDYQLRKPHQDEEDISNLWIRLFYWKWQAPKVLEDNLPPLLNALDNQKFNEMGDILQVIGRLTMLSDYGYNPLPNEQQIENYFKEYLDLLTVRNIPANLEKIIRKNESSYKGYGILEKIAPNLRKLVYENTIERAIKTIKKNGNLIEFIKKDNFAVLSQEQYMSVPLMNLISPTDFANLINFTGEINYEPITAFKNRYRSADNLKEQEKDWLEQLKDACLKQINKMDAPYKSQRKELFEHEFKDLE
ncbi:hypothetical protein N5853_05680 [Bartonella sp. HY329]|uniref:hypothetical protein n=1 Tax=unclassified Bartonella TaxID=2645622 RepID=UPI0021C8DD5E|nr:MULTISPECIES: hypothetical protein [unclassified Bartonella]UXM96105.1 hypothetical protein N5853_05680 [Bartonella sp. HY329]UXN10429.1 hypothetical protein N5852_05685 [Bartonella sp. HY328]